MIDPIGPTHPPDPATLQWMAAMLGLEYQKVSDQYHLLAAGTDRVMAQGALNTLKAMADMCLKTAAAVEQVQAEPVKEELPEGVMS